METPLRGLGGQPFEGIDPGCNGDDVKAIRVRSLNVRGSVAHHADRAAGANNASCVAKGSTKNICPVFEGVAVSSKSEIVQQAAVLQLELADVLEVSRWRRRAPPPRERK